MDRMYMFFLVYPSYSQKSLSLVILAQDLSIFIDRFNNDIFYSIFSDVFLFQNYWFLL